MKGPATIRASHVPPAPLSRMSQQTTPTKTAMPVLPAPDDSHFSSDDSPAEDLQLSGMYVCVNRRLLYPSPN